MLVRQVVGVAARQHFETALATSATAAANFAARSVVARRGIPISGAYPAYFAGPRLGQEPAKSGWVVDEFVPASGAIPVVLRCCCYLEQV